jgi:hypothetical protein
VTEMLLKNLKKIKNVTIFFLAFFLKIDSQGYKKMPKNAFKNTQLFVMIIDLNKIILIT